MSDWPEFAVMAETKEGKILALRKGFATRQSAEDHPVKMSLWKQVWVEQVNATPPAVETTPPFPWTVLWSAGRAYLVDADGRKFASLLGSQKRREHVAKIICDLSDSRSEIA